MKQETIAIITARGGSKRIPRKNIKDFAGKPIIGYSIAAAFGAGCFDEIMVSTDDQEIASVARVFKANVPFLRSKDNSGDFATTADAIAEVLSEYSRRGMKFKYACCIYPTAPFITGEKLIRGYELLKTLEADSIVPIVKFDYSIQRALEINNGRLGMIWPENRDVRSQDLKPAYHDAGQFYWLNVERFLQTKVFFGDNSVPLEIPPSEVQDIDTEEDWVVAELKFGMLKNRK